MKFEHYAINVEDPVAVADWYVAHCEMSIALSIDGPPYMRFLADKTGRVVVELYCNLAAKVPDYKSMDPIEYHLAFAVEDAESEMNRLIEAGASFVVEVNPQEGSRLVMLRDPFGMSLQLCQRVQPFTIKD